MAIPSLNQSSVINIPTRFRCLIFWQTLAWHIFNEEEKWGEGVMAFDSGFLGLQGPW
jgi:hypothetical protein